MRKYCFKNNIYQLRIIFGRLRTAGLKANALKCSFGLKEITYLCYVITRKGIKTDPNKLKETMDLGRPDTTTEARALISIVQYYMDIGPR